MQSVQRLSNWQGAHGEFSAGDLGVTIRLFCVVVAILMIICFSAGCSPQRPPLADGEWCSDVRAELTSAGVSWPIANGKLNAERLESIQRVFDEYALRAGGNLEIASKGWLQGFEEAKPYLLEHDEHGFTKNVSESLRRQLHLANVQINNICSWTEW